MNRRPLAIVAAIAAVLLLPAIALGHTAVPKCGGTLTLDRGSRTADITRTDTDPDRLVFDDVDGNGTYAVVPGIYRVVWSDNFTISHLEVNACPSPTPTSTPKPTPTASPSASPTPSTSPSPSPSASATSTPSATPTPSTGASPSPSPVPSAGTPRPTLPPTDLLASPATPPIPPEAPLLLLAGVVGFGVVMRRVRPA